MLKQLSKNTAGIVKPFFRSKVSITVVEFGGSNLVFWCAGKQNEIQRLVWAYPRWSSLLAWFFDCIRQWLVDSSPPALRQVHGIRALRIRSFFKVQSQMTRTQLRATFGWRLPIRRSQWFVAVPNGAPGSYLDTPSPALCCQSLAVPSHWHQGYGRMIPQKLIALLLLSRSCEMLLLLVLCYGCQQAVTPTRWLPTTVDCPCSISIVVEFILHLLVIALVLSLLNWVYDSSLQHSSIKMTHPEPFVKMLLTDTDPFGNQKPSFNHH